MWEFGLEIEVKEVLESIPYLVKEVIVFGDRWMCVKGNGYLAAKLHMPKCIHEEPRVRNHKHCCVIFGLILLRQSRWIWCWVSCHTCSSPLPFPPIAVFLSGGVSVKGMCWASELCSSNFYSLHTLSHITGPRMNVFKCDWTMKKNLKNSYFL